MIVTMLVPTGDYQHQGVRLKETQELLEASENRLEEASGTNVKCYIHVSFVTITECESANRYGFLSSITCTYAKKFYKVKLLKTAQYAKTFW